MAKEHCKQWLWELGAAEIHHLHSDNGIFHAELFVEDCKNKFQTQSFSGVVSHHQNTLAEWSIQTIMYMASTFFVHVSMHWSKYGADNIALWDFAAKHAVWFITAFPTISLVLHQWNCSPRLRPIIATVSVIMFGDVQSMSLIQSYKMDRRFLSGIVNQIWANFWDSVMYILLLWPMSATFLLVMFHHSIIWSLTTSSKLCLALAMMPCLVIFATIFLTLIAILISMMKSSLCMTLLLIIHLLLTKFGWVNMSNVFVVTMLLPCWILCTN